jgi:hypothetical protein
MFTRRAFNFLAGCFPFISFMQTKSFAQQTRELLIPITIRADKEETDYITFGFGRKASPEVIAAALNDWFIDVQEDNIVTTVLDKANPNYEEYDGFIINYRSSGHPFVCVAFGR